MTGLDPASGAGRRVVLGAGLGATLAFLDGTLVQVALPDIARDLGATFSALQWIMDGYLLALSALLLLGGALGDRLGRKRTFAIGIGAFAIASLGCGLAPSADGLVLARVAQGVAAALLVPGSLALVSSSFEGPARAEAIGIWSAVAAITTAAGPMLGGWIVASASWRWAFLVNLPVAVAALWALRAAPETFGERERPLDVVGSTLAIVGLGGACFALIEGPSRGFTTPAVAGAGVVGAIALVGFVGWERRTAHAMIPSDLFVNPAFAQANVLTALVYFALSGAVFLTMLLLQSGLGRSPLEAGLTLLPMTAALALLSRAAGRLATARGPRLFLGVGPMIAAVGISVLATLEPGANLWPRALGGMALLGLGMAAVVAPLTTAVFASAPGRRLGVASGVNNAVSRVAGLLAVAALPALGGAADVTVAGVLVTARVGLSWSAFAMAAAGGAAVAFQALHRVPGSDASK